ASTNTPATKGTTVCRAFCVADGSRRRRPNALLSLGEKTFSNRPYGIANLLAGWCPGLPARLKIERRDGSLPHYSKGRDNRLKHSTTRASSRGEYLGQRSQELADRCDLTVVGNELEAGHWNRTD